MSTAPETGTSVAGQSARRPGWYRWLDERYQLGALEEFARKKTVPVHKHSYWYFFGGVALFLFIIQVVSGALLLVYYRADADAAFESVQFIMSRVQFGWLVRSIHVWSANLMVFAVVVHMFSVFFLDAYRKPRELTWLTGIGLLVLSLAFGFSGYLLPWNEISLFATKVGTDMVAAVPFAGTFLLRLLRGGDEVTGATLSRFFGLHVAILPGIFTIFLLAHLAFIQRQGIHEPKLDTARQPMQFFPDFFLRELLLWLIFINILATLAVLIPSHLGVKADLLAPAPAGIKPEWYFLFMFETLKLIPATVGPFEGEVIGILGFGLLGVLWAFVPFLSRGEGPSRGARIAGVVLLLYATAMTVRGMLT
jgi:cytochrome b6